MRSRLTTIAHAESCRFPDDKEKEVLDEILTLSGGDMRRAVTSLQSAHSLSGGGTIKKDAIAEMAGLPPANIVEALLKSLKSGSFNSMETEVMNVIAEGFAAQNVFTELSKAFIEMDGLDEMSKADLAIRLAEADKNLVDGADEVLQLMSVGSLALRCLGKQQEQQQ